MEIDYLTAALAFLAVVAASAAGGIVGLWFIFLHWPDDPADD